MKITLIETEVQQTIRKNNSTSYGLTLAVGLPFPAQISERIREIQQQLEALLPGRFIWYGLHHLHATLVAPLRGRYRNFPPLQQEELPANLDRFFDDLNTFFSQQQPFDLNLGGVYIIAGGYVMVGEEILTQRLASTLKNYPELDAPKHLTGLHVSIGYFKTSQPFINDKERASLEAALVQLSHTPVGRIRVQQIWLAHYANRTLDRIVGKVPFILGQPNTLTTEQLLRRLAVYLD